MSQIHSFIKSTQFVPKALTSGRIQETFLLNSRSYSEAWLCVLQLFLSGLAIATVVPPGPGRLLQRAILQQVVPGSLRRLSELR